MTTSRYCTIAGPGRAELRVKGSVFIGSLSPVSTRDTAEAHIASVRAEFSDATHNCFAYRIDEDIYRHHDDGEPASSAGRPILARMDKYRLHRSALVVTRYFGGTRLGVGGLIQAYGECAERVILSVPRKPLVDYRHLEVRYPYKLERMFHHMIDKYGGAVDETRYDAGVTARISIPLSSRAPFEAELNRVSAGAATVREISV